MEKHNCPKCHKKDGVRFTVCTETVEGRWGAEPEGSETEQGGFIVNLSEMELTIYGTNAAYCSCGWEGTLDELIEIDAYYLLDNWTGRALVEEERAALVDISDSEYCGSPDELKVLNDKDLFDQVRYGLQRKYT